MAIKIDKSRYTPEELAQYEALVAKGSVDPEANQDEMTDDVPTPPKKKTTEKAEVDNMDETKKSDTPAANPEMEAALEELKELICQYVDVEEDKITEDARFMEDLGFNSFDFMSLVGEVEEKYDVEVEERDVVQIRTVKDAMDYISSLM